MNKLMNKKGNISAKVAMLIGLLILVVMVVAVAPTMFNGSNNITGAPTWFNTVFPVMIAAGLIFLLWRAVSGSTH